MKHHTSSKAARWMLAVLLAGLLVPALFAQDAPEQDREKKKENPYQPEAMEAIARYIEAIGGEEAMRKQKHRTMTGEIAIPMANMRGSLRMHMSAPNNFLMVATLPGVGESRQGFNGEVAWSMDPMQGPMLIEGAQAEEIRRQADFHGELNYKKNYKKIEHAGKEQFRGGEAHKIRLVDRSDKESFAFFHPETHLYIGVRAEMESPMGKVPVTTLISDYREVDGIKIPMTIRMQMMQMEQQMKFDTVSHDEIPESTYELPEAIKALLPEDEEEDEDEPADAD